MTPSDKSTEKTKPHQDHTFDPASPAVHPDSRAADIGASGALERNAEVKPAKPAQVDHGIDKVLKEDTDLPRDHGGEPADSTTHKDQSVSDIGSSGATRRS